MPRQDAIPVLSRASCGKNRVCTPAYAGFAEWGLQYASRPGAVVGVQAHFAGRMAMRIHKKPTESRASAEIIIGHVRADARQLLERIKTTADRSARRELARRAFHLAQIAAMEESPSALARDVMRAAGRSAWRVSANL
jgi:hypothetical protein